MNSSDEQRLQSKVPKEKPKKRLGERLIEMGLVSEDQIQIAITEQKKTDVALGKVLVNLGFVSDAVLRDALGEVLGKESIDLTKWIPDNEALKLLPLELARRFVVLPVAYNPVKKQLKVAMTDTFDVVLIDRLRAMIDSKLKIIPLLASEPEIIAGMDQFYGYQLSMDGILREIETGEVDYESVDLQQDGYSHPLVRLVNAILSDAVKRRASDIHFEPEERFLRLRYRIDGVLKQIRSLHKDYWSAIVVRLKVMARMNIAETRSPQDGRISLQVAGGQVDFRVSAQPTTYGENFVLRVLDRTKGIVPLEKLQIYPDNLQSLYLMMARPEGIILVTGPTGSGKTTTLYSMLSAKKSIDVNIMTLEDPVEYQMDMIRQTDVNEVARMDFGSGIRSLMRQDPDIILVGEIRDEDTAIMAFRAAMTGHQVFSTLHTNSALGALPRLKDIGVTSDIMSGNITGIVGQRLLRTLCETCKTSRLAEDFELLLLGETKEAKVTLHDPVGCEACDQSGYRGRVSILEVLKFDHKIDALIGKNATLSELKKAAHESGFLTLADDGLRRVRAGQTTLEELSRVVDLTERIS